MLIKTQTGLSINTSYITAIEEIGVPRVNQKGLVISHTVYTVDGHKWSITEDDYKEIILSMTINF